MKEKNPADSATAPTSCKQVTFSLPLYELKEFFSSLGIFPIRME